MKLNLKIIALLLILCLFSVSSVCAIEDTNSTDEELQISDDVDLVTGDTTSNPKTFTELENTIKTTESGDTIELNCDYEYNEGFNTEGIVFDKTVTINGNGHTLDGKNTGRIFYINGDNVVLKNITFQNGFSSESVGAIGVRGNNIVISDCTFINNYANGTSSPDGTKVIGGALYINANNAVISNNKFINNTIRGSGGAIALDGYNHKIEKNTFMDNKAIRGMNGGAILVGSGKEITIKENEFINNTAEMGGGAVDLQHSENDLIENNTFINNLGDYGAALSIYNTSYFKVSNNVFIENHATIKDSEKGLGGAIRVYLIDFSEKSIISKNKFYNNTAIHYGGTLYIFGDNIEISENEFDNSSAGDRVGGTINIVGNDISITYNDFKNSDAGRHGGAIEIAGNNNQIKYNNFLNTVSDTNGGALFITGNSTMIENNNFTDGYSKGHGGSIYIIGSSSIISDNNFTNNIAKSNGGAIRVDGDSTKITGNIFSENNAVKGNDIYLWKGNNSNITNNTFNNYEDLSVVTYGDNIILQDNKGVYEKTSLSASDKSIRITLSSKTLTALLKDAKGKILSGKTVYFTVNGKTLKATTDKNGKATVKVTLKTIKSYPVTIKFYGDSYYKASTKKITVKITKEKTKLTTPTKKFKRSATKKVTVTLKSASGKKLAKKTVVVKVNGKNYKAKTNKYGKATVKVKLSKKATYIYKVTFKGDKLYKSVVKKGKIIVK